MDYVDIDEKMSDEKIVTTVIIMLEGGKDYPIFAIKLNLQMKNGIQAPARDASSQFLHYSSLFPYFSEHCN
ncbi:hypothetical protein F2P79_010246 [Pimephales promelas]|nr:hypothetical protein F2P79_010246 [Pimephales promelas]